jgi:hypothetical protein
MKIRGRELDELEEAIVVLALACLAGCALLYVLRAHAAASALDSAAGLGHQRALLAAVLPGILVAIAARDLSLFLGVIGLVLWLVRRFAGSSYQRLRGPRSRFQRLFDR